MDGKFTRKLSRTVVLAAVALAGFSGCQTLRFQHTPTMKNAEITPPDPSRPAGTPPNSYTIEFRRLDGRVAKVEQPLSEASHVQEALAKAGAFKKFSRVSLQLVRATPNGGEHTMGMEHSDYSKRVEPEYDYALRAGDKIVVHEANESMLDDALNGALAPLGLDRAVKSFTPDPVRTKYKVRD